MIQIRRQADQGAGEPRGPIARFFATDHRRLDALLAAAGADPAGVHLERFGEFRAGILKHIAMEEKRLIPAAAQARGQRLEIAARLRADHGAIAALLVPTPTFEILAHLRSLLPRHNEREEESGGLYDQCDRALGAERAVRLVEDLRTYPDIRLKPYNDGPAVEAHIRVTLDLSRRAWETR